MTGPDDGLNEGAANDGEVIAAHFDAAFYLSCYPDVAAAGIDPLDHFVSVGWQEGRNPHPLFDVAYYLSANPDVARTGINPFVHYVLQGQTEGRRPQRELHAVRRHLDASMPLRSRVQDWLAGADRSEPMKTAVVADTLRQAALAGAMVVSVSHDDYLHHSGGVQNVIGDEQHAFAAAGYSYLHLSPACSLPLLAEPQGRGAFRVRVLLDGRSLGVAVFEDVLRAIGAVQAAGTPIDLVVHHLMGWAPELVAELAQLTGRPPTVWLHDFFALCPSYALMRNGVAFCHAPPAGSVACQICTFGEERQAHVARMTAFFAATRPVMLAPSNPALAFWQQRAAFAHSGTAVVPLARLLLSAEGCAAPTEVRTRPLRVAHLGARVMHKGWTVFESLALSFAGDARYEFYHFGLDHLAPLPGCVRNVPVNVTMDRREAMIEAIAERSIDVVVGWSLWPETFCFAVHEAIAAGAYVIARADAGNMWPAVQEHAPLRGCRLEHEAELVALFRSGAIMRKVAEAPPLRGALLPGRGTADWLLHARERLKNPAAALATADA